MIPRGHIVEWRSSAPWIADGQVEQDLMICRALVALYSNELIASNLAFRGGTALHNSSSSSEIRPIQRTSGR